MTRLEWVLKNTHTDESKERIMRAWCPSDFGLRNIKCCDSLLCTDCWNQEVEESGGGGMSRCPICGSKDCCGGYYQEVQDVLVEALEGAKWLIECYVAKPERYEEYQDVVKAIRKRGERRDENEE